MMYYIFDKIICLCDLTPNHLVVAYRLFERIFRGQETDRNKWERRNAMNNLLKIICKENRNRVQDNRNGDHTDHSSDSTQRRTAKERRMDCERIRVQTWMPEV